MLSLDPNAVNQKYPGNDLVEEYLAADSSSSSPNVVVVCLLSVIKLKNACYVLTAT